MTIHIECEECESIGYDGRVSSATVHGHIIVETKCLSGNRKLVRRAADCAVAILRGNLDVAETIANGEHIKDDD